MKHKIISTSKAEILVVDLPEDARNLELSYFSYQKQCYTDDYILIFDSKDRKGLRGTDRPHLVLPKGNWQSLIFDEETAKSIVDYNELNDEFLGRTLFYRKYPDELHENFVNTALESLQSLIEANVFTKNPFGDKDPEFEDTGNIESDYNYWANKATEWQQAEESVFRNPYYFFKLK